MDRWLIVALVIFTFGCRDGDEAKQGVQGEFCEGSDLDCRQGFICDRGYCRLQSIERTDCHAMCDRIISCGQLEESCVEDCRATIAGDCDSDLPCPWSDHAVDAFGDCIINQLSCDEIATGDGPQLCYEELSISDSRKAVCDDFLTSMEDCGVSDTQALQSRCYQLGRTATDDSFQRTNTCSQLANEALCLETIECLNAIFVLSPPLTPS